MSKVVASCADAVDDIADGATIAFGGFGLCGVPFALVDAILARGVRDIEAVSNNAGIDGAGLGCLLEAGRLRRIVASYVGENREFARQYLGGDLEVELVPQGTLAERMRGGGCGIPAFFTPAGVGTLVADGGLPWRYGAGGDVTVASPKEETRSLTWLGEESEFVLEHSIVADFAMVRARLGDEDGNLVFSQAARNFNPLAAMCARVAVAEVEQLVPSGRLDPDDVHLPGVFVHRVVALDAEQARDKRIEKLTVRANATGSPSTHGGHS